MTRAEVLTRAQVSPEMYNAGASLYRTTGRGYEEFWYDRHLYRLVKGSKGSKKSKTTALWFVYHLMKYPQANLLCVRKQANTIRYSMFADLEWAMIQLNCVDKWTRTISAMNMTREYEDADGKKCTQTIIFRGLDDPLKAGSLSISQGYLCWVWIEEFFEIESEETFTKLAMSIRGEIPPETGLWKQYTMTFNPWSATSWIKKRFFDEPDPDVYTLTTTYKCNEFLSDVDRKQYEDLYVKNPHLARIVCDGDWGVSEGLVYENWVEEEFDIYDVLKAHPKALVCFGLDFGYSISYNAFVAVAVDVAARELWVFDEMYDRGMTNLAIARRITEMGYSKEEIWADAAEPKSIYELQMGLSEVRVVDGASVTMTYTLPRIKPAHKGPDSLRNGIQRLQSFRWHVHPKCENCIIELQNYCFDRTKDGEWLDRPIKEYDHVMDSVRYALSPVLLSTKAHFFEVKGGSSPAKPLACRRVFAISGGDQRC